MRLSADVRISIKDRNTGENHKVEIIKHMFPGRVFVRFDGRNSERAHDVTKTELSERVNRLIRRML